MIIYEIPKNHKLYNEHIFYIGTIYKDIYFLIVNKKVDQKIIKKMIAYNFINLIKPVNYFILNKLRSE